MADKVILRTNAIPVYGFLSRIAADLSEGDYINIPARKRHRVVSTSVSPETIWLAVHY